jgi:alpha-beta hydrolase superfamily lysophospholipase
MNLRNLPKFERGSSRLPILENQEIQETQVKFHHQLKHPSTMKTPSKIVAHPTPQAKDSKRAMTNPSSVPATATLLFKGTDLEPPQARTEHFEIQGKSGNTLHLRQWHPVSSSEDTSPVNTPPKEHSAEAPIILMVHGLGGTTDWLSPFANKLLEQNPLVFGLDIPEIGTNPTLEGHFKSRKDIIRPIEESITYLAEKHHRPVYAVGLSLGGLLVTHMAANPPKELSGIVVISPAYKGAPETFKPGIYIKSLIRYVFEKAHVLKKGSIAIPFAEDQKDITRNPEKIRLMRETKNRIKHLSTNACVELIKLTLLDTPKAVKKIQVPLMLFVAEHDRVCDPQAMFKAFEKFPSIDKRLYVFPEAMHDLTLDPEMPTMANTISDWIGQRALAKGSVEAEPVPQH